MSRKGHYRRATKVYGIKPRGCESRADFIQRGGGPKSRQESPISRGETRKLFLPERIKCEAPGTQGVPVRVEICEDNVPSVLICVHYRDRCESQGVEIKGGQDGICLGKCAKTEYRKRLWD